MGKGRRKRRSFSPELKAEAIRVFQDSGKSVRGVARELDLTETALRRWVTGAQANGARSADGKLSSEERAELDQLRREVKTLRMERDIPKKATAFFAKDRMKFAFIAREKASFPVNLLCRVLGVSRAGFYASQRRPVAARRREVPRVGIHVAAEVVPLRDWTGYSA